MTANARRHRRISAWMIATALVFAAPATTLGPSATAQPAEHKMSYHEYRLGLFAMSKVESAAIVMLGDSLTEGAPWRELTGCPHLVNRGIGGDTTKGVLARLDEVIKLRPRAVFLMIGVNDVSLSVPQEATVANFRSILDRLAGANIHSYSAYVLPVAQSYSKRQINGTISALNDQIGKVLAGRADAAIDLRPLVRSPTGYLREDLSFDGLHINPKGYGIWRDAIADAVAQFCMP
jgi:lysophospholipase L1-like esterase